MCKLFIFILIVNLRLSLINTPLQLQSSELLSYIQLICRSSTDTKLCGVSFSDEFEKVQSFKAIKI